MTSKSKSTVVTKIDPIEIKNVKKLKGNGKKKNNVHKIVEETKGNTIPPPKPLVSVVNSLNGNIPKPNISPIYSAHAPTSGLTPDFYLKELFLSFQKKMSLLRSNGSSSSGSGSGSGSNNNNNSNNSSNSNNNSDFRNQNDGRSSNDDDSDRNRNGGVRYDSSDPVQFSADVAASGVRTIVIGTYTEYFFYQCISTFVFLFTDSSFSFN